MTLAQLSLTTPFASSPQLCPGASVFPPPGPAWFPEVPPFPNQPRPRARSQAGVGESPPAHSHFPLPSRSWKARCPVEKGTQPRILRAWVDQAKGSHRWGVTSALAWSCCVVPGASSSRASSPVRGEEGWLHRGVSKALLEFSNFLAHLDVKCLKC